MVQLGQLRCQIRRQIRHLLLTAIACLLLTSCVDYDLGIRFDSQTHGQLTQTIHVGHNFTSNTSTELFKQLTAKAKALSGKARPLDENTLQIVFPFSSGQQLIERFNAFYGTGQSSDGDHLSGLELPGAPTVSAHLALQQNNYLFALRNHLTYDLQIDSSPELLASSKLNDLSWLNLDFHLSTPWGVTLSEPAAIGIQGQTATWQLTADQPQHIEATFWLPSPIGIGAGAIALFCLLGYTVKYRLMRAS